MKAEKRITGKTRIAALLGNPVGHSISPQLHNTISRSMGHDIAYVPFKVEKGDIEDAVKGLRALNIVGFNVTIPFKSEIIKYIDEVSDEARLIGAVNTVRNEGGKLLGYNTDADGFRRSFTEEAGHGFKGKSVAIIGAGGAAKAIAIKVAMDGPEHINVMNRTASKAFELSELVKKNTGVPVYASGISEASDESLLKNSEIIINTTSLGMYPDMERCPIKDFSGFDKSQIFYDIIYNPPKTRLLKEAEKKGCKTINGLGMLLYQGIYAYEIWMEVKVPEALIRELIKLFSNI